MGPSNQTRRAKYKQPRCWCQLYRACYQLVDRVPLIRSGREASLIQLSCVRAASSEERGGLKKPDMLRRN